MLGSSIASAWASQRPDDELVAVTRDVVDLTDAAATRDFITATRPDAVIHAAARVAGIADKLASPATFLLDNLSIDSSVISGSIAAAVPELLYISSGAIYPADLRQPLIEEDLLTGPLEGANEGYALAKIAGGKLCAYASKQYGYSYRAIAPSNLYGPNDSFGAGRAHLVASTISKMHDATQQGLETVLVWGDGTARREFTFSDDLAAWIVSQIGQLEKWPDLVNAGVGFDHTVREYYEAAARVTGFAGTLEYDTTKPSGVMQRLLDSRVARDLGWNPTTSLDAGYAATYAGYLAQTAT